MEGGFWMRFLLSRVLRKEPPRARSPAELFIRYPCDNVCGRAFKALLYFCINIFMPNATRERRAKYIYISGREISRERIHVRAHERIQVACDTVVMFYVGIICAM